MLNLQKHIMKDHPEVKLQETVTRTFDKIEGEF